MVVETYHLCGVCGGKVEKSLLDSKGRCPKCIPKPVLQVGNLTCEVCGNKKFEMRYRVLACTKCGSIYEWSSTWEEWYMSSGHVGSVTGQSYSIRRYDLLTGKKVKPNCGICGEVHGSEITHEIKRHWRH